MNRAKELASAHWGYIESLLKAHNEPENLVAKIGFHYRTALEHGYKHGLEAATVIPVAEQKQEVAPLDFSLPYIALECTAHDARRKYEEESREWRQSADGGLGELIEAWDVFQAAKTWQQRSAVNDGVVSASASAAANDARSIITTYYDEGQDVMAAKAAMLLKNAKRGYYAPEVNAAIIASNGQSWNHGIRR